MSSTEAHHGTRVFQSGLEPVVADPRPTSTAFILAEAEPGDITDAGKQLNKPFAVRKPSDGIGLPADIRDHIDSLYDQAITTVIVSAVDGTGSADEVRDNRVGDRFAKTGIHSMMKAEALGLPRPKLCGAPDQIASAVEDGISASQVTAEGIGYNPTTTTVAITSATGKATRAVPVIGSNGELDSIVITHPGYGHTAPVTVTITDASGSGSGASATATVGQVLDPVVAEAAALMGQVRGMWYTDGPDGTNEQAVAARKLIGDKRVFLSDPRVLKNIDGVPYPKPSSPIWMGLQAKQDKTNNLAWPGSNMTITGIQGVNRPIAYGEESNYLNFNHVNTILSEEAGFRAWGVWTCSSDPLWQFVNVVRVTDYLAENIEEAFRGFNDRPALLANLDLAVMSGRGELRKAENNGLLLPGSDFWLADGNTPTEGSRGIFKFGMKHEVPAPMVDLQITQYRNIELAYELLFDSVTGRVEIGQLL